MKILVKIMVAGTLLFMANNLAAQENPGMKQEKMKLEQTPEEMARRRTEKMKEELSLTEAQSTEIYSINLAHATEMQKLRAEQKALREKMKAEREATRTKIKAVLTPEQNVIFDQMMEEQKKKHEEHRMQEQD